MTPRKPPLITSTPKANSTFVFPATSPRLTEHRKNKPSISDLLAKDVNPLRNSDTLIINNNPISITPQKVAVPKLKLDTVFATENEDLSDF